MIEVPNISGLTGKDGKPYDHSQTLQGQAEARRAAMIEKIKQENTASAGEAVEVTPAETSNSEPESAPSQKPETHQHTPFEKFLIRLQDLKESWEWPGLTEPWARFSLLDDFSSGNGTETNPYLLKTDTEIYGAILSAVFLSVKRNEPQFLVWESSLIQVTSDGEIKYRQGELTADQVEQLSEIKLRLQTEGVIDAVEEMNEDYRKMREQNAKDREKARTLFGRIDLFLDGKYPFREPDYEV